MQTPPSPLSRCPSPRRCGWRGYLPSLARLIRRLVGLAATSDTAILADMVSRLKLATEEATNTTLKEVALTAPWQPVWRDDISIDSDLNDALVRAGLAPWTYETSEPIYQGEIHAVLAANDRWLCQPYVCWDEDKEDVIEGVYFIRFASRPRFTLPAQLT